MTGERQDAISALRVEKTDRIKALDRLFGMTGLKAAEEAEKMVAIKAIEALPDVSGYPMEIQAKELALFCDKWTHTLGPGAHDPGVTERSLEKIRQNLAATTTILKWYNLGSKQHSDLPGMAGLSKIVSAAHDRLTKPIPGRSEPDIQQIIHILDAHLQLCGLNWQEYLKELASESGAPRIAAIYKYTDAPI